jgi:hypothetical protein
MNSALICHSGDPINDEGFARWLSSFSELKLIVRISDPSSQFWKRLKAERRRSGVIGLTDVLAFRIWHRLFHARSDRRWEERTLETLRDRFPGIAESCRVLSVDSPNLPEVAAAFREESIDFAVARCKRILTPRIFTAPKHGVFVIHPGICPEYRNSHGCFWAIVRHDYGNVGATLLQIDEGIDTGPVLGYLRVDYDPLSETHIQIQDRAVIENLETITSMITDYLKGDLPTTDTTGRPSAVWGQPRLSSFLLWRLSRRGYRR